MRIFEGDTSSWGSKVNFVDDAGVFVGFDLEKSCCEEAGWCLATAILPFNEATDAAFEPVQDVDKYSFDRDFFVSVADPALDEGNMVVFKLQASALPDLYLHIYNAHNGYYGHGVTVEHDGEVVRDETL